MARRPSRPRARAATVAIALVSDAEVRALNRRYRRKDQATDVLSFPVERGRAARGPEPASRVFSATSSSPPASRGARPREAGHSYATELQVLALHGLLHLLGYDHHDATTTAGWRASKRGCGGKGGLAQG